MNIVLLAGPGPSTSVVYHFLASTFGVRQVVLESPVPRVQMLKRRRARLGTTRVLGQVAFQALVVPMLRREARGRRRVIMERFDESPIPEGALVRVSSANAPETRGLLARLQPDVVVINGTRILSRELLGSVKAPFVNMHAGITPLYRGVHGAYWALVEGRPEQCGVTVHCVDAGIDTGGILHQAVIRPTADDNFTTYPLLQLAAGLPLLERTLNERDFTPKPAPSGRSALWSHPTLGGYLFNRLHKGVR